MKASEWEEGKQEWALEQWKMRSPTPGVLGDDSPSGTIQTFHKVQDCGYSKVTCSERNYSLLCLFQ